MADTKTTLTWMLKDEVSGPAKKMDAQLGKSSERAKKFGEGLKVVALGAAALGAVAIGAGVEVFKMGAQFEAMDAKAQTVFGDSLGTVKKWAETNAEAMGLTRREATGLAANMGDLLIPMGFTRDAAAAMSTQMVGLSGALSEWSGGTRTAAEVSSSLQKALLGEREELKSLGISISEADVKAQMLKDGTDKLTGAAYDQAKAQATMTLILAKSTDAQAAYEAGTAKGLRSQAQLTAKFNEAKEALVTALYPILVKVTSWIAERLPSAIKLAGNIFNWLSKNVFPVVGVAIGVIVNSMKGWIAIIGAVVSAVRTMIGVFQGMARIVVNIWSAVTSAIKGAINAVIRIINGAIRGINRIQVHIEVGPVKYDFWGLNLKYIPYLHKGGIVPGVPGSDQLAMLQAGEQVIPRTQAGEGVYIRGISERELVDMVDRGLYFRLQRAAPTLGRT